MNSLKMIVKGRPPLGRHRFIKSTPPEMLVALSPCWQCLLCVCVVCCGRLVFVTCYHKITLRWGLVLLLGLPRLAPHSLTLLRLDDWAFFLGESQYFPVKILVYFHRGSNQDQQLPFYSPCKKGKKKGSIHNTIKTQPWSPI